MNTSEREVKRLGTELENVQKSYEVKAGIYSSKKKRGSSFPVQTAGENRQRKQYWKYQRGYAGSKSWKTG